MSNHPKPGGGNPHPKPKNNDAGDKERNISGNVHVRGEIMVELGPEEANARGSSEKKEDARKRKVWWLEVATFIVLSIYAGFTAWQSWSTQRIVNLTREQFTKDQRPWLAVDPPTETVKGVFPFKLNMLIRNTGRTPARNVIVKFNAFPFLSSEEPRFIFKGDPVPFGPIAPNAYHIFTYRGQTNENNEGVPNGYTYYAYGSVAYQDVFTDKHWITYCFFKQGTESYAYCKNHNDIGDGEPPSDPLEAKK